MTAKKDSESTAVTLAETSPVKADKPTKTMCANHPDTEAAYTTTSTAHEPISLCKDCLARNPELKDR